jgi:hypothetical protein
VFEFKAKIIAFLDEGFNVENEDFEASRIHQRVRRSLYGSLEDLKAFREFQVFFSDSILRW